ncbi:MAG TPA: hypothetical protein VLJ59_06025 [Mycobacteriales bacterium]|nr:hypothetical protein [Mycobacteriales bacterium]
MPARLKDDRLARLADDRNVARFVSFSPGGAPELRHLHLRTAVSGAADLEPVVAALLAEVGSVNVRTFTAEVSKGMPFDYGKVRADDVAALVRRRAAEGYYTIVNETIDVNDGGVSGVALGGIVEFAPDGTPRAVEENDAAVLPHGLALDLLRTVYGFTPDLPLAPSDRIEFSIHPGPVGYRHEHTVWWEIEQVTPVLLEPRLTWPNRFSRFLGDKAFGLLVGHLLGLPVPNTTVIHRRVAPFSFGTETGSVGCWLRTCPTEQMPGKFTTVHGWADPFRLLQGEDPDGELIPSVLAQQAVEASYSGATMPGRAATLVEGVAGAGDEFMLGEQAPERLPAAVVAAVEDMAAQATKALGPIRLEWAHDGRQPWVLQLHLAGQDFAPGVLNPGDASRWLHYDPATGLEVLRELAGQASALGAGVLVDGRIGLTSHIGDILRKAGIPARLAGTQ